MVRGEGWCEGRDGARRGIDRGGVRRGRRDKRQSNPVTLSMLK